MRLPSIRSRSNPPEASIQPAQEGSAGHIALLLAGARLFFLVVGLAFFLGEVLELLATGNDITSRVIVRIAVLSIMAPAIVWFSTRWAEKVLRQAFENQTRLIEAGILKAAEVFQSSAKENPKQTSAAALLRNEHAVLAQMGRIATSSLDIQEIYGQFSQEVRNILGFDLLVVCTVDDSKGTLRREFVSGESTKIQESRANALQIDATLSADAIERKATMIIQGMGKQELLEKYPGIALLIEDGMASFITSPLFSKNRVIGIMGVASKIPMAYTERDREFVESASLQIGGALANSQLHALVQRDSNDKELLAEIGRVVNSSPHLDDVFDGVGDLIRGRVPAEIVSVTLTSAGGGHCRLAFTSGHDVAGRTKDQLLPMTGSLTERVTEQRCGEIVPNATEEKVSEGMPGILSNLGLGLHSSMGVPLFSNDLVIGCLQFSATSENAFDSDHLAFAERIAGQIAGAMANSELNRALEGEIAEKTALAEIGKTMSMALDMKEVYQRFGEIVGALAPSNRFAVNLLTSDGEALEIVYHNGEQVAGREIGVRIPFEGSVGGKVLKTRSTIVLDLTSHSSEIEALPFVETSVKAGYRSILASPLIVNGEVVGVMQFRSRAPNAYGESVVRIIENVASHVAGFMANARLHSEVQAESHERTILAEIGRVVSSSPDIHDVYKRFADLVTDIIPSDRISIGLLDEGGKATKLAYVTGVAIPSVSEKSMIKREGSFNDAVMTGRKGLIVQGRSLEDVGREYPPMVPGLHVGLRSAIGVPLVANDQVIGCLQFRSILESAYTAKHLDLAERVSDQISGAIANSELRATLEQEAVEREALADIGKTMTLSLELEDVFDRFAELVKPLASSDRITISLLTEDEEAVYIAYTSGGSIPGRDKGDRIPLDGTLAGETIKTQKALLLHPRSASELEGCLDLLIPSFHAGFRSFIAVPLIAQSKVIGALQIRSKTENAYNEAIVATAESISAQVASAIANARLHASVQQESERRAVLAEIGRIISSSLDLETVYVAFAKTVQTLIPFDRISINVVDQSSGLFTDAFVRGEDIPGRRPGDANDMEGSITDAVMSSRSTLLLQPLADGENDLEANYPQLAPNVDGRMRSFLSVPLMAQEVVAGVLHFSSTAAAAFAPDHVVLAENVAAQIAGAISNAQLHVQVKASQLALSQSEWRYRHMVESASDIVCTLDDEGLFTYANQPITKFTEYTEEELLGRHFTDIVAPEWKDRVLKTCIIDTREYGEKCVMEFPVETKSGGVCWLEQTIAPMLDDGKIVGFQGIARDISARKVIESEREALIEDLQDALTKIQTLSGLLPICSACKKVRDDNGYWSQIETYISAHSDADFSHSICPDCVKELYPQLSAADRSDV